ncbi:hemicentin-1-like isoform X2 [Rhopilema esculentum]|eukprot:gene16844-8316_t
MKINIALFVVISCFHGIQGSPYFVSTPTSPAYVQLGSDVIFNWTYAYAAEPDFIKWYRVSQDNVQIGLSIMVKSKNNSPVIKNKPYEGRIEFKGNGRILLKNMSLSDEGYIAFNADFSDGAPLYNKAFINVTIYPSLSSPLPNEVIAIEGQTSILQCTFEARPVPQINWYSNQVLLVNGSSYKVEAKVVGYRSNLTIVRSTLTIHRAALADSGNISCVAEIPLARLLSSTNFKVHYPPKNVSFFSDKPNNTAVLGDRVTFTCNATALPTSYFEIYRNGILLANSSNQTFTIKSAAISDEGTYQCTAANYIAARRSVALNLTVQVPPALYASLNETITVIKNSSARLSCTFYGEPVPSVTWHKFSGNGAIAVASSSRILKTNSSFSVVESEVNFRAVDSNDHGVYRCIATNSIGSKEMNITLNVTFGPELVHNSPSQNIVPLGTSNFTLSCIVISNPAAFLEWFINGTKYAPSRVLSVSASEFRAENHTRITSILKIESIEKNHFSNYSCTATNALGTVTARMSVVVTYKPELIASSPSQIFTNASSSIKMTCDFESNPRGSLYWRRNSANQPSFSSLTSFNTSMLQSPLQFYRYRSTFDIQSSNRSHSGVYTCGSQNSLGAIEKNMTLVVNFAPQNLTYLSTSYIFVNGSGAQELECLFEGNPDVTINWLYNGTVPKSPLINITSTLVSKDLYHERKRSILKINVVDKSIQGVYRCIASNHQGSVSQETQLVVLYKPVMLSSLSSIIIKQRHENASLYCKVSSNPSSNIVWYKDGVLIRPGQRFVIKNTNVSESQYHGVAESILNISQLVKEDSGDYKCTAANSVGTAEDYTRLIIQYAPTVQPSFGSSKNVTESSSSYELKCLVEANPMPTIRWYHNGVVSTGNVSNTVISSNDTKSIVESSLKFYNGVKRTDNGTFLCNASNLIGSESKSVKVNVWYGPDFLIFLEGTVNSTSSLNASFKCKAVGHPVPTLVWFKSNVPISNVPVKTFIISDTETIVESELHLVNVSKNDSAEYSCEATSTVQSKKQTVNLNVLYDPVLPFVPPNITANFSQRVVLDCSVDANPPVTHYRWTKDGNLLSETGPVHRIGSATEMSAGIYICTPIYALRPTANVTFNLKIQVPARITSMTCRQTWKEQLNCECVGYGIPAPELFWTKNNESAKISSGATLLVPVLQKNDQSFHCHAKNKLANVVETYNLVLVADRYEPWSRWGSCNVSCGAGYQTRARTCKPNFPGCPPPLSETEPCNGSCVTTPNATASTTPFARRETQQSQQDETWTVVLYVLIPVLAVFCIILLVWLANSRGCRREEKEFIVPLNNSLSQPPSIRSMPTRRGIYLPDNNFGVLNSGYRPDGVDVLAMKESGKYDTVEVEMEFGIEGPESTTEAVNSMPNGNGDVNNTVLENGDNDIPENLSFYNSAYTHL